MSMGTVRCRLAAVSIVLHCHPNIMLKETPTKYDLSHEKNQEQAKPK